MSVKIKGMDKLQRNLKKYTKNLKSGTDEVMEATAQEIIADSQSKVPVKTGTLKRSAYVKEIKKMAYRLGYSVRYALPVHERVELNHDNGEAKFLEKAIEAFNNNAQQNLARLIKKFGKKI